MRATSRSRHVLGIAVGEKCLSLGQIAVAAALPPAPPVLFSYPAGLSLQQPRELGLALRQFLAQHRFDARHAVLGVPAKWLICKPVNIPPADDSTAHELLWIQATATVPADLGAFIFDYLGGPSATESQDLLLLGLGAHRREQLLALAVAANLKPLAIRPTPVALAYATTDRAARSLIITASAEGIDVLTQQQSRTASLRHVGPITATQPLLAQLRRMLVAAPPLPTISLATDSSADAAPPKPWDALVLWDEAGLPPAVLSTLESTAAPLPLIRAKLDWVCPGCAPPAAPGQPAADATGAAALALANTANLLDSRGRKPVGPASSSGGADFLHPRLRPPVEHRLPRKTVVLSSAIAAAVILLAVLGAFIDLAVLTHQVDGADAQLQSLQPELRIARPYVATMQFASGFQTGSARYLACIGDLTLAIPEDGHAYLTSFSLDNDMSGAAVGQAASEQDALALLDKLRAGHRFAKLKCKLTSHQQRAAHATPAAPTPQAPPAMPSPGPPGAQMPMQVPTPGQPGMPIPMPQGAPGGTPPGMPMPPQPSPTPSPTPAPATNDVTFSLTFNYQPSA